jgi:hypothetical protein
MFEKPNSDAAPAAPGAHPFEQTPASPSAPPQSTSDFPLPASDFETPSDFNTGFHPSLRLTLHSLRHRLRCTAADLESAVHHLLIQPAWLQDQSTGHILATVTLPEATQLANLLLSPNSGEAADNPQPSTNNPHLLLKKPGRYYIIQLSPQDNPRLVKLCFTTDLPGRLDNIRCIAPPARNFAHWPAEEF